MLKKLTLKSKNLLKQYPVFFIFSLIGIFFITSITKILGLEHILSSAGSDYWNILFFGKSYKIFDNSKIKYNEVTKSLTEENIKNLLNSEKSDKELENLFSSYGLKYEDILKKYDYIDAK